jgi:GxxExxY protein
VEYKYGDTTYVAIAAAMEVHRVLGVGFPEVVYQRALEMELEQRKIVFAREVEMPIYYKGSTVGSRRVDFLIDRNVCMEIKAVTQLEDAHLAQALNYLEAFNLEVGVLLNFGSKNLQIKRLFNKRYDPLINYNPQKL